jgi:hypothetical protein
MIIKLILLKAACCLLYPQPNDYFLVKRGMFQSKMALVDSFEPAPIDLNDPIIVTGYIKGHPLLGKSTVFKCQNNLTKIVYICKSPSVRKKQQGLPMEIHVFQMLKTNPHRSFIHS